MKSLDSKLEQMLAKPEFLPEPVFSKGLYLAQAAHGLLGHFLRLSQQSPEVFKQVQQAHTDSNSCCLKVLMLVADKKLWVIAWTYDFDAQGPKGRTGRDLFIARAKPPGIKVTDTASNEISEQVLGRRVLRIQVESDEHSSTSTAQAQIVRVKDVGWYAAGLVLPGQNLSRKQTSETSEQKRNWWRFW